jgi:hypothetical protein
MSSTDLLAKIDALDWDHTVSPATTIMANGKSTAKPLAAPKGSHSLGMIAGGIVLLGIAAAIYFGMGGPDTQARKSAAEAPVVAAAPPAKRVLDQPSPAADAARDAKIAAVAAAEEKRAAMYAQAAEESERKLHQKAERQRKAQEAAAQVRLARDERERHQQEEAKQRAEREAAAAAKAQEAAAAPKGPASPKELCAGESNVFARGFCESRACGKPEWHNHPFCLKRMEDQLRSFGPN